ncbi:protein TolR [Polymorphobacter glacialis]|uniref:Protein TolR n=1 Tax=Sandarakinorhabdus glacialis TaxID=1614636 RepID=A0A916ZNT7_9SPHN|nr:ExbD/TolR family protein [Polymorphobacter glacialis]GGE06934.1 protein TolR [Polymorphobacter glacialis]
MAMGLPNRRGRRAPMADINITPMVDVMLVLLIIFMVTAPLLVTGVPIDLPDSKAKALQSDDVPIQVSIDSGGQVFIDQQKVPGANLAAKLAALRGARRDEARVYVRADRALDYGRVMQLVGEVSAAGFRKVALVSDQRAATASESPAETSATNQP